MLNTKAIVSMSDSAVLMLFPPRKDHQPSPSGRMAISQGWFVVVEVAVLHQDGIHRPVPFSHYFQFPGRLRRGGIPAVIIISGG